MSHTSRRYGDNKTKSVRLDKFSEFENPKLEARRYLDCYVICYKSEDGGIKNAPLTRNERDTLKSVCEPCCRAAGVSVAKYITRRLNTEHVCHPSNGGDATVNEPEIRRDNNIADDDAPEDTTQEVGETGVAMGCAVSAGGLQTTIDRLSRITYEPLYLEMPDLTDTGFTTVIFGASKSGKTTLAKEILKRPELATKELIKILIAPNQHSDVYGDMDKSIIRTDNYDGSLIKGLHRLQKKTKNRYSICLIIDDCVDLKYSSSVLQLFCTMRNSKISTIMLLQAPTMLSKNSRYNVNNVIMKRFNTPDGVKQLMEFFIGAFEPFRGLKEYEQVDLYYKLCENYAYINFDAINGKMQFCRD